MRNFSKLNTSLNSANISGNRAKAVMKSHDKTFFSKFSKLLAQLNEVFNFEKFLIYVLQNSIETLYVLVGIHIS